MFSSISVTTKISLILFLPFLFAFSIAYAQEPSLVGTVEILDTTQEEEIPEIIVTPEEIPQSFIDTIEAKTIASIPPEEPQESESETEQEKLEVIAIKAFNNNIIKFPSLEENVKLNIASQNNLQIINGPADLDILSTAFVSLENVWNLGLEPYIDIVQWEFSKDSINWFTFDSPEVAEVFDTHVAKWSLHNFYFRLKTPTKITNPGIYGTKITIIVSEPEV